VRAVSTGYFEALGRRLIRGRLFEERDVRESRPVLVVNRTFAERYLEPPWVGAWLASYGDLPDRRVVGVVEDARPARVGRPPQPEVLAVLADDVAMSRLSLLVRTTSDPAPLVPVLRDVLRSVDPALVPTRLRTMDGLVGDGLARPRLYSALVATFAAAALLVVAVGLFGSLTYAVTLRRREIGVRVALGATPGSVVGLVTARALAHTAIGLMLGLGAALAGGRLLEGLLFGVQPHDPLTLSGTAAALLAVAVLAAIVPARRAARLDPQQTLREIP
jgi:hypothetical protein